MPGLTLKEAHAKAVKLGKLPGVTARVVTIIPGDTPRPEDRAHDVEVTVRLHTPEPEEKT